MRIFILALMLLFSAPALAAEAIFAGGCFWSMESNFSAVPGVTALTVGYTGGTVANPTYEQVSTGKTGHREAIRIEYDPEKVSYAQLLDYYWRSTDPTDAKGQFCDHADEYRPAIFYAGEDQKMKAEQSKQAVAKELGETVVTEILPAADFYPAEEYHQHYFLKNSEDYKKYREGCRRDERSKEIWRDKAFLGAGH